MAVTYAPATNFGAKDSLPQNDPDKVIKGSEFTTEFTAIQTAFGLAAPAASPTFTGTVTIASVDINGGAIDGTTIGGTTPAAGTFSSLTATTADINGGTIDGVTIGGSSAGAITGTTGQFNTSLNVDGAVTADGLTVGGSTNNSQYAELSSSGLRALRLSSFANNGNDNAGHDIDASSSLGAITLSTGGTTRFKAENNGDISFYDSAGSSQSFFWDASAESLLVGTDSGDAFNSSALIRGQGTDAYIQLKSANTNSAGLLLGDTDDDFVGGIIYNNNSDYLYFHSNNEEAMRIDSSGNLLVGTTESPGTLVATSTESGFGYDADDFLVISRPGTSGQACLILNKLTDDGQLIDFRFEGATVGSIASTFGIDIHLGTGDTRLRFVDANDYIRPANSDGSSRDGLTDLGVSDARFKDLYRSGSTISTSDRNMKQDERPLTDAEAAVAQACKGLLKAFRFIDAVETDGDGARIHFGIIAQDLQAAFEAEGLDANNYAMFRPSTITDDEGNEQTRLGVCYENLLAFIIAAL